MSKERELLARVAVQLLVFDLKQSSDLVDEIQELLAQPEHIPDVGNMVTQEPVAWIYDRSYGDNGLFVECVTTDYWEIDEQLELSIATNIRPLYASPPKHEPLSDGTTADMWHANKKATHPDSYWAGVSDAEKAHKIGIR